MWTWHFTLCQYFSSSIHCSFIIFPYSLVFSFLSFISTVLSSIFNFFIFRLHFRSVVHKKNKMEKYFFAKKSTKWHIWVFEWNIVHTGISGTDICTEFNSQSWWTKNEISIQVFSVENRTWKTLKQKKEAKKNVSISIISISHSLFVNIELSQSKQTFWARARTYTIHTYIWKIH